MALMKGILSATLVGVNTVLICIPLMIFGPIRLFGPQSWRDYFGRKFDRWVIDGWVGCNRVIFHALRLTRVHITWEGAEDLTRERWYMVVSNHQSWSDIVLLQTNLFGHIPAIKFFTKRQLLWIPFLGQAMWILGFPYVRRMSKAQIAKNPKLKKSDREATIEACEGFRKHPTTVLNFLEGTRFTEAKHARQRARFERLLNPKVGGLSYVMSGLNDHLHKLVDITISYPHGTPTFWEFMQGLCPDVNMLVQCRTIPADARINSDSEQRKVLTPWIEEIWREKDQRLLAALSTQGATQGAAEEAASSNHTDQVA
jgi:1-acyl-sn-glycerol-3-phosphate acyltransferase